MKRNPLTFGVLFQPCTQKRKTTPGHSPSEKMKQMVHFKYFLTGCKSIGALYYFRELSGKSFFHKGVFAICSSFLLRPAV